MRVCLPIAPDDVEQRDVVEDLVSVVPGEQGSLPGVVVHHADVGVLVVEGDVGVFVSGGVGVVGKVDLGPSQVGVGDVEGSADHEGLPSAALGEARVPTLEDLQGVRVQAAHLHKTQGAEFMAAPRETDKSRGCRMGAVENTFWKVKSVISLCRLFVAFFQTKYRIGTNRRRSFLH